MDESTLKALSRAPGSGPTLMALGEKVTIKAEKDETGGSYALFEIESQPGGGTPLHVHSREDESFYVVQGTYEFRVGNRRLRTGPGYYLLGPRDIPHAYRNVGDEVGRLLVIATPAGMESFFREISQLPADRPPDPAEVAMICRRYGIELLPEDAGQAGAGSRLAA